MRNWSKKCLTKSSLFDIVSGVNFFHHCFLIFKRFYWMRWAPHLDSPLGLPTWTPHLSSPLGLPIWEPKWGVYKSSVRLLTVLLLDCFAIGIAFGFSRSGRRIIRVRIWSHAHRNSIHQPSLFFKCRDGDFNRHYGVISSQGCSPNSNYQQGELVCAGGILACRKMVFKGCQILKLSTFISARHIMAKLANVICKSLVTTIVGAYRAYIASWSCIICFYNMPACPVTSCKYIDQTPSPSHVMSTITFKCVVAPCSTTHYSTISAASMGSSRSIRSWSYCTTLLPISVPFSNFSSLLCAAHQVITLQFSSTKVAMCSPRGPVVSAECCIAIKPIILYQARLLRKAPSWYDVPAYNRYKLAYHDGRMQSITTEAMRLASILCMIPRRLYVTSVRWAYKKVITRIMALDHTKVAVRQGYRGIEVQHSSTSW